VDDLFRLVRRLFGRGSKRDSRRGPGRVSGRRGRQRADRSKRGLAGATRTDRGRRELTGAGARVSADLSPNADALDPGFHGARTHCIRGFMAFHRLRPASTAMLMVSV